MGGYRSICVVVFLIAFSGCASMTQKCTYHPNGIMKTYRLRSTVIGTGETEMVSTDCAVAGYSTKDTGLSDNGKEALGEIAEKAVRGAVGSMIPMPQIEYTPPVWDGGTSWVIQP